MDVASFRTRSRAFPPQAVLRPCFSTGWRSLRSKHCRLPSDARVHAFSYFLPTPVFVPFPKPRRLRLRNERP